MNKNVILLTIVLMLLVIVGCEKKDSKDSKEEKLTEKTVEYTDEDFLKMFFGIEEEIKIKNVIENTIDTDGYFEAHYGGYYKLEATIDEKNVDEVLKQLMKKTISEIVDYVEMECIDTFGVYEEGYRFFYGGGSIEREYTGELENEPYYDYCCGVKYMYGDKNEDGSLDIWLYYWEGDVLQN